MKNLKLGLSILALASMTMVNAQDNGRQEKCAKKFEKLDANDDAQISKDEFISAKEAADAKRAEREKKQKPFDADQKIAKLDSNKDGKVDRAEFDQKLKEKAEKHGREAKDGSKHFNEIDANKDGQLTKDEIVAHHEQRESKRAEMQEKRKEKAMSPADKFEKLDTNKDGMLDKAEFENGHKCNKKGGRTGKAVK